MLRRMTRVPLATIETMIRWIEDNLDRPLDLDRIAAHAGYSPFHFSRLFVIETRRSVMAYVRARRLVRGAKRLLAEPELRLVDLASDCGFDSQEAFTRAFRRLFGASPRRFRSGFAVSPIEGQYPMSLSSSAVAVSLLPEPVVCAAFRVAGVSRRFDDATKAEIHQLWSQLVAALPLPGQADDRRSYGVISRVDRHEGSFAYLAGVRVDPAMPLPAGVDCIDIAAATHAVFRIVLDGGPVHLQMKAAMARIWSELIPRSGLVLAEGPDFESYDNRVSLTEPGAIVDIHVPIRV